MIRLSVVAHQIVNLFYGNNLLKVVQIFIKKIGVHRFNQHIFFACDQIGVIRSAEFRFHDNIKNPERGVHDPYRVNIFL